MTFRVSFALLLVAGGTLAGAAPAKKPVSRLDDLPRHSYAVTMAPSALLENDAAFATLAGAVHRDIDSDLAGYDIRDRVTLQRFKTTLLYLALLDRDFPTARGLIAELRGLEEKPSLKLLTGLTAEAWMDSVSASAQPDPTRFQARFAERLERLPWAVVQNDLKQIKAGYEIRSRALIVGSIADEVDPAALRTKSVSADVAAELIAARVQLAIFIPLKNPALAALDSVIAPHRTVMVDRWTKRLVTLTAADHPHSVVIGIWDSGSDPVLYAAQLYTDAQGRHGFAYDLHSNPVSEPLYPLGAAADRIPQLYGRLKGFLDLEANVDSPEASQLKRFLGTLRQDEVKPTLEDLGLTANYCHGTHVTGIAIAGNPYARIVIGRITFDYHLIPETPTIEQARKDAAAYQAQADYFRTHGVRVVNMSWGGSLRDVEHALEANGAGGTGEERAKLARQIFDIGANGLRAALASAPDTLFVAAAGNSDNNVKFDEVIPSSFQLPNLITVGAVDRAGDETSFSSFGPMVNVHANGFEVDSYIPGGKRMKLSGTSMAAPQVTNLAAKLFALDPALTVADARALILSGCDTGSRVRLVNPAKSVALLKARLAAVAGS